MIETSISSLPLWFFRHFLEYKEISHFISSRIGGCSNPPYHSLNLGFHVGDNTVSVLKNRERLAMSLGISVESFTTAAQIHDCNVRIITSDLKGKGATDYNTAVKDTDAMITDIPGIYLMVLQADCVPILFLDFRKKIIGVVHAGWKGTLRMVTKNTVNVFMGEFSSSSDDIIVGMGPSIGPCCYIVGSEIINQVRKVHNNKREYINEIIKSDKYLDLWNANKIQLMEMGIPEKNIEIARICTFCNHTTFFSYRSLGGETGRFGAGIMLRE